MQPKAYSRSLKKLKMNVGFQYSMTDIDRMQRQVQKQAQLIKIRPRPIKNYIQVRKQMVQHKFSKNKLEQQVDKIISDMVKEKKIQFHNNKLSQKRNFHHYRIETESSHNHKIKSNQKSAKFTDDSQVNQQESQLVQKRENKKQSSLPRIKKSASHGGFQKSRNTRLKTYNDTIQRLANPQQKIYEYINIDTAMRQYRAGMTSLMKGVYSNNHNPYQKRMIQTKLQGF